MSGKPESAQFDTTASRRNTEEIAHRKFVTFAVAEQRFAVDILSVREIRIWTGATRLPNARPHVRGVINLRGAIIPVIDLSLLFAVARGAIPQTQVIVIVDINGMLKGLLVDSVSDIVTVAEDAVTAIPSGESDGRNPLFSGLINGEDGLVAVVSLSNFELAEPNNSNTQFKAA